MSNGNTLGKDLRALRLSRKLKLEEVAGRLNRSVGWLSQVERDISTPSLSVLREMATLFDVPMSMLFGAPDAPAGEQGLVVRAPVRRIMGSREDGLSEALISPDLTDSFEVIHSTFEPGSARTTPIVRATQEVVYMIAGKLDIWLDDDAFTVTRGDSFRIRDRSFRWANPYAAAAIAIWVISPPVY